MYDNGLGVKPDEAESYNWYRKAADAGNSDGQCALGELYEYGSGVESNHSTAVKWYRKAANAGNARAMHLLGNMYLLGQGVWRQSDSTAFEWYRKAAEAGDRDGQSEVAWAYKIGFFGKKDEAEAFKWYLKSSEQGKALALNQLGSSYEFGHLGLETNFTRAVNFHRAAADVGDNSSREALGDIYANGTGVQRDYEEALKWYRQAANTGDEKSQMKVARILAESSNVQLRDGKSALAYAEGGRKSKEVKRDMALDILAAAYAEVGEFDKAIGFEQEALALKPSAGLAAEYEARLKLYQAKVPYRDPDIR